MTNGHVNRQRIVTPDSVADPLVEVDFILDRLGDILDGRLDDDPDLKAYELLAAWAGLKRARPRLISDLAGVAVAARANQMVLEGFAALAERAITVPDMDAWLERAQSFADSDAAMDHETEAATACGLLVDLDEADLVLWAVNRLGPKAGGRGQDLRTEAGRLEQRVAQCKAWFKENACCFLGAGVLAEATQKMVMPDLAEVEPDLAQTCDKYTDVLQALEQAEADVAFEGAEALNPAGLMALCANAQVAGQVAARRAALPEAAEEGAPAEGALERARQWIDLVRPRVRFEDLVTPVLRACDLLLGGTPQPALLSVVSAPERMLGSEEEPQTTSSLVIPLAEAFGRQLWGQAGGKEEVSADISDDVKMRLLGEEYLRSKLPWAGPNLRIQQASDPLLPDAVVFAALVDRMPGKPEHGSLKVTLISRDGSKAQVRLTAICPDGTFSVVTGAAISGPLNDMRIELNAEGTA